MPTRIVFTFDEQSHTSLCRVQQGWGMPTEGAALGQCIEISRVIHDQAALGFTEVLVRNSQGREREILIPSIPKR